LSQQVFEQSLIAKYSANPLLFWEDNAVAYITQIMLQQLAAMGKDLGWTRGTVIPKFEAGTAKAYVTPYFG